MKKIKTPPHIRKAIKTAGKHYVIAIKAERELQKWLEENHKEHELCYEDYVIDSLQQGNDGSDELIRFIMDGFELESEQPDKGDAN